MIRDESLFDAPSDADVDYDLEFPLLPTIQVASPARPQPDRPANNPHLDTDLNPDILHDAGHNSEPLSDLGDNSSTGSSYSLNDVLDGIPSDPNTDSCPLRELDNEPEQISVPPTWEGAVTRARYYDANDIPYARPCYIDPESSDSELDETLT